MDLLVVAVITCLAFAAGLYWGHQQGYAAGMAEGAVRRRLDGLR